ncbi:MAG TPA: hypothetical protein DIT01_21065 [Lentisphaeria bacterium]|nr:hypothetical protein [Lentisphaeria bacterium]
MATERNQIITDDETYGPVPFVQAFDTEEEMIGKANDTQHGLAAYALIRNLRPGLGHLQGHSGRYHRPVRRLQDEWPRPCVQH